MKMKRRLFKFSSSSEIIFNLWRGSRLLILSSSSSLFLSEIILNWWRGRGSLSSSTEIIWLFILTVDAAYHTLHQMKRKQILDSCTLFHLLLLNQLKMNLDSMEFEHDTSPDCLPKYLGYLEHRDGPNLPKFPIKDAQCNQ